MIGYAAACRHHPWQLALSVYRLVQNMARKAQSNHIVGRGKAWQVCSRTNTRECSDILLQVQLSTSALPHPTPRLRALPSEGSCLRIATKFHRPEGHGKIENVAAFVVRPSIACIPMLEPTITHELQECPAVKTSLTIMFGKPPIVLGTVQLCWPSASSRGFIGAWQQRTIFVSTESASTKLGLRRPKRCIYWKVWQCENMRAGSNSMTSIHLSAYVFGCTLDHPPTNIRLSAQIRTDVLDSLYKGKRCRGQSAPHRSNTRTKKLLSRA